MKPTSQLLLSTPLAVIGILSFTAGIQFEFLMLGLMVAVFLIFISFRASKKLRSKLIILTLVLIHLYLIFIRSEKMSFEQSLDGVFLSKEFTLNVKWIAHLSAAICLSAFWSSLLLTFYSLNSKKLD